MLRAFNRRGLITTRRDADDRRHTHLALTAAGHKAFAPLDRKARDEVVHMLAPLSDARNAAWERWRIRGSLDTLAASDASDRRALHTSLGSSRRHGLTVHRHGAPYQAEYAMTSGSKPFVGLGCRRFHRAPRPRPRTPLIAETANRRPVCRREVGHVAKPAPLANRGARARHRKTSRPSRTVRARGRPTVVPDGAS
jgi:hypothetical protein